MAVQMNNATRKKFAKIKARVEDMNARHGDDIARGRMMPYTMAVFEEMQFLCDLIDGKPETSPAEELETVA